MIFVVNTHTVQGLSSFFLGKTFLYNCYRSIVSLSHVHTFIEIQLEVP